MSEKIQYLTENHYLTCSKGTMPKRVKIDSQDFVKFSGTKVATVKDKQTKNNFTCAGSVVFKAGAAVGLACALIPGPGWVVAIAIAAIVAVAAIMAVRKCKAAASSRFWIPETVEKNTKINGKSLLTIDSCMECPAEGGTIKAKATLWEAWGSQIWTNLGHLANFAFGFLVGRGAGAMVSEGATAYGAASSGGASATSALGTAVRATGQSFLNTAKKELVSQFNPFGNWKGKSWICNGLRGFGLFGAYKQHYDTWTDDEKTITEKLEATAVSLILDVFAAKGMTFVCFPAGTKVHTQWGLANIESLEEGIEVLTYNEETGEKEYKPILKTTKRTTSRMCIVELSNGETLRVTPEHRFYSDGKWVPIEEFEIGDLLETKEDVYLVIENKAIITTLVEVFNLEIEGNENYYVTIDGVLVHNGCKFNEDGSLKTKNQKLKNKKHPVTGVPFKEKTVIIDGKEIKGVFPEFDSKFTTTLSDDLLKAKDTDQFKHCTEQLKKQIEKDPSQATKYTEKQLEDIMNGEARPDGLTWHHNEQTGVMELVDRPIHVETGHTGGNSIWGDDIR